MRSSRLTPELVQQYTRPGLWENQLIDDYVADAAQKFPNRTAIVDRDRGLTFGEIDGLVSRTASVLRELGVRPGEAVSWQLPNWAESVIIHHAVLRIGAVSNPIVAIYRAREVGFILRQARSRVFFAPSTFRNFDYAEMVEKLRPDLPDLRSVVLVGGDARDGFLSFDTLVAGAQPAAPEPGRSANDVMLLLYTSGTTSDPKGALHTHNTLDYENRSIKDLFGLSGSDAIFMPSPLTHITGLLYGTQLPFMLGSTLVLQDMWNPAEAVSLIDRYQCTFCVGATPFLHGILEEAGRRPGGSNPLRVFACGGADVPPDLIRRATTGLDAFVTRVYGSTEFPTATSSAPGDPVDKRATTDGRRIGEAHIRIVTTDGAAAPIGTEGELQVRGPEMFLGYLDEELNPPSFTDDGWFRTGDVAIVDHDGFMRIAGRIKDIIIRGGENISAKEIEDLIFEHPKVAEVSVVGVPDPVLVERVCAVVVPRDGADISLAELVEFLSGHGIAKQKLPERLVLEEQLPKTASGKVQKFRLRNQLREARSEEAAR
jgi:cyclohexanecarboxylate-CoA ligase